jgi:hypothetical protein
MDEFNLVEITGAADALAGTRDIEGLLIHDHGQRAMDDDQYRVAANATDDAVAALQQRGFTVDIIYSAADLAAHFAALDAETSSDPGAEPIA